jgi:hypothetical protein
MRSGRRLVGVVAGLGILGLVLVAVNALTLSPRREPKPAVSEPLVDPSALRLLPAPDGGVFDNPQWLPGTSEIVVTYRPPGWRNGWETELRSIGLDGSNFERLPLPNDPECRYTSGHFARALPDGRLAYAQRCWAPFDRNRGVAQATSLMAYDPATGSVERLRPYILHLAVNFFDFAPDLRVGVINNGRGLYEGLEWLLPDRLEPLKLPLERAGFPSWSPDGTRIALDGAPEAFGREGVDRLELPRKLYLLSADEMQLQPLVEGLRNAGGSAWSPDGRWLAAWLHPDRGEKGLWLVEVATGKLHLVVGGDEVGAATWAPDGRTLVATVGPRAHFPNDYTGPVGLFVIDLPDLDRLATR